MCFQPGDKGCSCSGPPSISAAWVDKMVNRTSTFLYQHPRLGLFLLLGPPLVYMLVVYLGSLFSLLINSFYVIDGFTGLIVRKFTLSTYAQIFSIANREIFTRTASMAAVVTLVEVL